MTPYLTVDEIPNYAKSAGLTMDDVNEASVIIDSYVGRSYGIVTHTESAKLSKKNTQYGKVHKGRLRHFPRIEVLGVTAIVPNYFGGVQTNIYDPSSLYFDDEEFEYFMFMPPYRMSTPMLTTVNPALFSSPIPSSLTVNYTSGYVVFPEEIKIACGQVMDAVRANGGTTTWKSRSDFDMTVVLNDKEDPIMSGGIIKLLNLVRLS